MKHQYKIKTLSLLLGASFSVVTLEAAAQNNAFTPEEFEVNNAVLQNQVNAETQPAAAQAPITLTPVVGEPITLDKDPRVKALKNALTAQSSVGLTGNENFSVRRHWVDELGKTHTHFDQTINGLKVYGTSLIMHKGAENTGLANTTAQAEVYAISGNLAIDSHPSQSTLMRSSNDNGTQAISAARTLGKIIKKPELAYVYLPETGETKLA